MTDWETYYNQHLSRSPRSIVVRAVSHSKNKDKALDIGAGTLVESKFLLDSGFSKVVAIDSSPEIENFAKAINDKRLEVHVNPFQDLVLATEDYDLISAQYALPFYGPKGFEEFIAKLISSLKIGGIFVGQFFGERDGWNNGTKNMAFQTKEEAQKLLEDLSLIEFTEEEKDGKVASGEDKHWHVFHFIGVK